MGNSIQPGKTKTINLSKHFNWPKKSLKGKWWQEMADRIGKYPRGKQTSWGIPFMMGKDKRKNAILVDNNSPEVRITLNGFASHVCILHQACQLPKTINQEDPAEGLLFAEYKIEFADGSRHIRPIRGRFEVPMVESPGPTWLTQPFDMMSPVDPKNPPAEIPWHFAQTGVRDPGVPPLIFAMENPCPKKIIRSILLKGTTASPVFICGVTLFRGKSHPLRHLPRRTFRINAGQPVAIESAEIDFGIVVRKEKTRGKIDKKWLDSPYTGVRTEEPSSKEEDHLKIAAAEDATLTVKPKGSKKRLKFSVGDAFAKGFAKSGKASLQILDKKKQWMQVKVIDSSTGKPTPVRMRIVGRYDEYIAPYGHHEQINDGWFQDYGADVVSGGRNYAYVDGNFTTDLPVGDIYVEINKGFEYQPVRKKVTIKPGQRTLELSVDRFKDLRSKGWVTADTHVHFVSPHTAWLEGQCEGVNVINLLASQWGRLFTNVGDVIGRANIVEDDTIVYVGTENRNHMLGHMSMLGTKGAPVYPMCCGGPGEAWIGDPDFMTLAEWALENKRKGGVVIRPHYPYCGHTEDPVPILKGLVDALEIGIMGEGPRAVFPVQEWYRYLNCGYRIAVCGGTDKMGAGCAIGWNRTYAKLDTSIPFNYENWASAVRAGRTISTTGPLIDFSIDGKEIGDTIDMTVNGGTVEAHAVAESFSLIGYLEIVCNGDVVARAENKKGSNKLEIHQSLKIPGTGWVAARCYGKPHSPSGYSGAHTSPIYIRCGNLRLFNGPAAEHMLALVEGGIEYLNTISTAFDEASRKRMVKLFKEAQQELKGRLVVEAGHTHHHGNGLYHTHGHGVEAGHSH